MYFNTMIGSLPSIEKQKEWIDHNIIKYDPLPEMVGSPSPFGNIIADYMGVLPNENDFQDKQLYNQIQNSTMTPTYYRLVGHGKNLNGSKLLKKHLSFDYKDSVNNQCKVLSLNEKQFNQMTYNMKRN